MRIAVLGTGYVGLVSAACLAELGHSVTAVDIDPARIELLRQGGMPLYEPGLAPLVAVHQATGQLGFTVDLGLALRDVDVVMIAIGTPPGSDGQADVSAVLHAAQAVGQQLQQAAVLVMKSTVPVGTSERVQALVQAQLKQRGLRFRVPVVSNPEFLREGTAVRDFLHPDRVIVGAARRADSELMHVLYGPLVARGVPLLVMDLRSAELTKYAANVMLAARISLINEIACIAEGAGADIEQVRLGLGSDKRLGPDFLRAGIGYGGSCFPKDVQALAQIAESVGQPARMLKAVHQVNEQQKRRLFERMVAHYGGAERLRGKRVAVWGLAFKPGTDDLREAPSLVLIDQLLQAGAQVCAYDPAAHEAAARRFAGQRRIRLAASALGALRGADALALVTEWPEFMQADPAQIASRLRDRVVFDGRNALDAAAWGRQGLQVWQVGRPSAAHAQDEVVQAGLTS